MSKAFDKININRLIDSCKRIGIPQEALNFIKFLHQDRKAKTITAYGLTDPISLYSGIEQGETFSPLLWKIYYDPILSYINDKHKSKFLKIKSNSPLDLIFSNKSQSITIPPLAFMDDTVWHCESKENLQEILQDVSELYQLNNIQVNPLKSDLLHISKSKTSQTNTTPNHFLLFKNQQILPHKLDETIRYLGIFLDGNVSSKHIINIITNKINQFTHLIKFKKLLLIHISRLFNTILLPAIEYILQICSLPQKKINQLSSTLTKNTKHILHLSTNTNNDILTNPQLLNIPTLNKLLLLTNSSNINRCLNSNNLLTQITISRIKEWLTKTWQPALTKRAILANQRKTLNFTIINQLIPLYKNNISINNLPSNNSLNCIPINQLNSIYNFLPNLNSMITLSLRNNQILFL